ncbi:MAG: hypothetical protein NE328_04685 [Lentisphaeraceae bacterium]|nr:hypothetical protein [Lentisphaeraceae bacterium]
MLNWILKSLYASVEISSGKITDSFHKIPKAFIIDLNDILETNPQLNGLLYIKMKQNKPHLYFKGNFDAGSKQRILNCWVLYKDKYK